MLANWTDQGIRNVKRSPRRLDAAKELLEGPRGEFKSFFLTMGDYDLVAVYEVPDDAAAAKFSLQLGMLGNVRTRTLKAFPEDAYRQLLRRGTSRPLGQDPRGVRTETRRNIGTIAGEAGARGRPLRHHAHATGDRHGNRFHASEILVRPWRRL